ncbi:MAG: geranylgeranyl diphosphate synthase type II [Planctomycetota bacterium]|jgi:geranylgeranyl diphosphate synthase type II
MGLEPATEGLPETRQAALAEQASDVSSVESTAEEDSAQGSCGSGCGPSGCASKTESPPAIRSSLAGGPNPIKLPRRLPVQAARPAQSNIPNLRGDRDRLKSAAAQRLASEGLVPPIAIAQLRVHAVEVCKAAELDLRYADYAAVLLNNESWREGLAQVPYERRLLLLPKCLRVEEHCPAPFDQFGMLCKECGLCSIEDLTREADQLGYAVLIAEGSAVVRAMIETGKIEAIVGVSCLNVLEKCFPHMEAVAIPGMSIPLLQDDCVNTNVDLDQVRDLIHLSAEDRTYRLDLEELKGVVRSWFTRERLDAVMGPIQATDGTGLGSQSDEIARDWLAQDGKRWRPYLATCMWVAVESEGRPEAPPMPADLAKLAVAVECFHKASLIHDDIEDGDLVRYGRETLHATHGVAVALNVGDLLLGEGYRLLAELDIDGDTRAALLAEAARGHISLSRGQGAELCWARDPKPLSSLEVLGIFREKTAPAFEVALRLGALFAGADDSVHAVLGPYSESLGIAYQIRDDVEDFLGEGDSDDLADLRPSLILAIANKRADKAEDRELLEGLWRRQLDPLEKREELQAFLTEYRILDKANELRDAYEQAAVDALQSLKHATSKGLLRRVIGKIFGDENLIEGYCGEFETRNAAALQTELPAAD